MSTEQRLCRRLGDDADGDLLTGPFVLVRRSGSSVWGAFGLGPFGANPTVPLASLCGEPNLCKLWFTIAKQKET